MNEPVEIEDRRTRPERQLGASDDQGGGLHGVALPERLDWATGQKETRPLPFRFGVLDLLRRLSPRVLDDEAQRGAWPSSWSSPSRWWARSSS